MALEFGEYKLSYEDICRELDGARVTVVNDHEVSALQQQIGNLQHEPVQKNLKISLLEDEMKGPVPYERMREKHIMELEAKTIALDLEVNVWKDQLKQYQVSSCEVYMNFKKLLDSTELIGNYCNKLLPNERFQAVGNIQLNVGNLSDVAYSAHVLADWYSDIYDILSKVTCTYKDVVSSLGLSLSSLGDENTIAQLESSVESLAAGCRAVPGDKTMSTEAQQQALDLANEHVQKVEYDLDQFVSYSQQLEGINTAKQVMIDDLNNKVIELTNQLRNSGSLAENATGVTEEQYDKDGAITALRQNILDLQSKLSIAEDGVYQSSLVESKYKDMLSKQSNELLLKD